MLRERNKLLRAGKLELATSVSLEVGREIASFNFRRLGDIKLGGGDTGGAAVSAMWARVNEITRGALRGQNPPVNFLPLL